jgi:tetratricopeptide (TPR) repeat protein
VLSYSSYWYLSNSFARADETILFLSEYALKRGLYDDARAHVPSILETNPSSIGSLILLVDIEEKAGNFSAALSTYEKGLDEFEKNILIYMSFRTRSLETSPDSNH